MRSSSKNDSSGQELMVEEYRVRFGTERIPELRTPATDLFDLGARIASHLATHSVLEPGATYDAQVGEAGGAIVSPRLRRPVVFTIG